MGMRQEQPGASVPAFWVVVVNHRARVFAVFGPLGGDDEWTTKVASAREKGWDITSSTVGCELDAQMMAGDLADRGFAEKADKILERLGYKHQA